MARIMLQGMILKEFFDRTVRSTECSIDLAWYGIF